jgi:hypothetical protein
MRARTAEALLREERWVSSVVLARVWGSQRMIQLGLRVGIVVPRAVVTARHMACV